MRRLFQTVTPSQEISSTVDSRKEVKIPLPPLPIELVREVTELAARAHRPTALSLALVSKVVNKWITPILYHTVILATEESADLFSQGIEDAQSVRPDDTKEKVRHISTLAIYGPATTLSDWTLPLCPDVQRLLLEPPRFFHGNKHVSLWPRPSHVVLLDTSPLWWAEIRDCFAYTTHLYMGHGLFPLLVQMSIRLPLTHICMSLWTDDDAETVRVNVEFMLKMPSMKIVLIHAFISGESIDEFCGDIWARLADIVDERLIVAPGMMKDDLLELFESGGTVWDTVEEWKDWRKRAWIDENAMM